MQTNYIPVDVNGVSFTKPVFWLHPDEYSKVYSEINQLYYSQYEGKDIAAHTSYGLDGKSYVYWFENHGFDNYNIYLRVVDNH